MNSTTALTLAGVAIALAACNPADPNRTTSTPRGVKNPTALTEPIVTPSAPPATAERGPIPANANAVAPGTDAAVALARDNSKASSGSPDAGVKAQEAAAKAPDTASGDAAKAQMQGESQRTAGTARDTSANSPRHGDLTKEEESNQLPKAGQVNNHSSTALEKDSGSRSQ
jgi:hypothetical protein